METLNIQCIEQQQVLITLTLTDSNGAPVDLTQYAVYAASVGAVDPYCRRAARLEWAAAINNECSAFIITAPGHDIARAPWKYQICIKNRQLGLEWAVVTGRVELTPRACGTDGISPAAYTVACEATPSGLVNVTLDATVGSISTTLEQVKASAAAAAAAAQNAHADLEDAETAATRASQAALAAEADARIASDKATAAEAAATAAPAACKPYVQQVQQAAAQALDASRTATTAAAEAQASADAAAPAQGYATRAESAQAAAVQAAGEATAAATTATQQAESATSQAESARLAATTATTAADNAQAAATRAAAAATRAEAATPAADRAEVARDAAEAAASTATTAAVDVPGLVTRAETAATAADSAEQAAYLAQRNAETAATTATTQAEAAAASATKADTDARAVAIMVPRAEAAQQAAASSASAAATSATDAAASATDAAASATAADNYAKSINPFVIASAIAAGTADIDDGVVASGETGISSYYVSVVKNTTINAPVADYIIGHGTSMSISSKSIKKCLFSDTAETIKCADRCIAASDVFVHLPRVKSINGGLLNTESKLNSITFSDQTTFSDLVTAVNVFRDTYAASGDYIKWAKGTTFANLVDGSFMFTETRFFSLPAEATFESLQNGTWLLLRSFNLKTLPAGMTLKSLTGGQGMFESCVSLEIDDLVRVLYTINDLQALDTPKTGNITIPHKAKHVGETVDVSTYITANYPDLFTTLSARGWTVAFA